MVWTLCWAVLGGLTGFVMLAGDPGHIPPWVLPPLMAGISASCGVLGGLAWSLWGRRGTHAVGRVASAALFGAALTGMLWLLQLGAELGASLIAGALFGAISGTIDERLRQPARG